MCAHVLRLPKEGEKHNIFYRMSEKTFDGMIAIYRHSLEWVLENPGLTLIVLGLTIALNFLVIVRIPKGFFPQQDTGAIQGGIRGPQDASFPLMNFSTLSLTNIVRSDPAVAHVNAYTGFGNGGFMFLALKPLGHGCKEGSRGCDERQTSAMNVINRLRPKMNRLPVATAIMQPAQDLRIGGRGSNSMYQFTIQSDNIEELAHWGSVLLQNMRKIPDLEDVDSDQQNGGLQEMLQYDRVTAARLGQTPSSLDSSLCSAFCQSEVSVIYTQLNQYYVVMEVAPQYWQDPTQLNNIYFTSNHSASAGPNAVSPLFTVMKPTTNTMPLQVAHTGLFPSVTVSFNLRTGVSLSDATREVTQMEQHLGMPATVTTFFSGTAQAYQQSLSSEPILVLTALLSVFIVLGILYESLVHPLTIISTLPSASVGAMLALMLFHIDLNVISIIGIILLIGIVKKNAIMMIDFALQAERVDGKSTRDAIFDACMLRFRPIMMTTMSAICGALPLAFGTGTGSELRKPLGITIVGGLLLSQMLTLYTTPVVYLTMDKLRLRALGRTHDSLPATAEGSASYD
jgi:multidrug efflux pump